MSTVCRTKMRLDTCFVHVAFLVAPLDLSTWSSTLVPHTNNNTQFSCSLSNWGWGMDDALVCLHRSVRETQGDGGGWRATMPVVQSFHARSPIYQAAQAVWRGDERNMRSLFNSVLDAQLSCGSWIASSKTVPTTSSLIFFWSYGLQDEITNLSVPLVFV